MTYGMPMQSAFAAGQIPYNLPPGQWPQQQAQQALQQPIGQQQMPRQQYAGQPYAGQPYGGNGRGMGGDRLPPQPDLMRRPAASLAQQTNAAPLRQQSANQQPLIRGGAPEEPTTAAAPQRPVQASSAQGTSLWKPIRVPTPSELGIATAEAVTANPQAAPNSLFIASSESPRLEMPARFDFGTVSSWLDSQGAKMCQREKLVEGVQIHCSFAQRGQDDRVFSVRGVNDEAALRELVRQVAVWKGQLVGMR
jgi:hypothetical protein